MKELNEQKVVQGYLENTQTTHNSILDASVGFKLMELASRYGNCKNWKYDALISQEEIDGCIQEFSKKIALKQDETLSAAWNHLLSKMNEPVNEFDRLVFNSPQGKIDRYINLKTVFALLYLVLDDDDAFQTTAVSRKEREENLYLMMKELHDLKKGVCHTGIRNDLAFTLLTSQMPGVKFIQDIDVALLEIGKEYLFEVLEAIKEKDSPLYFSILMQDIDPEKDRHLQFNAAIRPEILKERILNHFKAHGYEIAWYTDEKGENKVEKKVTEFIKSLDFVSLPLKTNKMAHQLKSILETRVGHETFQMRKDGVEAAKKWAHQKFSMTNDKDAQRIESFCLIESTYAHFKKFHKVLVLWNLQKMTQKEIDEVSVLLNQSYLSCAEGQSPMILSKDQKESLEKFNRLCHEFEKDTQIGWVENFFIEWNLAPKESKINLWAKLQDPRMKEKYQVTDAFLNAVIFSRQDEVYLPPYVINRIFLHAMTTYPETWSPVFYEAFCMVLNFVEKGFHEKDNQVIREALVTSSYVPELMAQLKYLKDYHGYLQNKKEGIAAETPQPPPRYIPLSLSLIKELSNANITDANNFIDFNFIKQLHYQEQIFHILTVSEIGFFKNIISNASDLFDILKHIVNNQRVKFVETLGFDFLKSLIKNSADLVFLMNILGRNFGEVDDFGFDVKSLIKNFSDFDSITMFLLEDKKTEFLEKLGFDFLTDLIINNPGNLDTFNNFQNLNLNTEIFFNSFGFSDYLRFISIIKYIPANKIFGFLEKLGFDFVKTLVTELDDLVKILRFLSEDKRPELLEKLGFDFVENLIKDLDNPNRIINKGMGPTLTLDLGTDEDTDDSKLVFMLNYIPVNKTSIFLQMLHCRLLIKEMEIRKVEAIPVIFSSNTTQNPGYLKNLYSVLLSLKDNPIPDVIILYALLKNQHLADIQPKLLKALNVSSAAEAYEKLKKDMAGLDDKIEAFVEKMRNTGENIDANVNVDNVSAKLVDFWNNYEQYQKGAGSQNNSSTVTPGLQ